MRLRKTKNSVKGIEINSFNAFFVKKIRSCDEQFPYHPPCHSEFNETAAYDKIGSRKPKNITRQQKQTTIASETIV